MGIECQILLSKTKHGIYRSGQLVIGILRYTIDKPTKFHCITIALNGNGKCWWSESNGTSSDSGTFDSFSGKEDYVCVQRKLLENTEHPVKAGVYERPFEFRLPLDLPSSFNDPICKIRYKIVAIFTMSGFLRRTKKIDTEIPVYGNVNPSSPQPSVYVLTKSPFTTRKPINVKIEIEKTFLKPGENIRLNCVIKNDTRVPIAAVQTKLITETTYMSDNKHKKTQRKIIDQTVGESPEIKANSVAQLICIVPTFPNLYSIQHSNILLREYKVNVTAKFPFPHRAGSVEIPVVIGNSQYVAPQLVTRHYYIQ